MAVLLSICALIFVWQVTQPGECLIEQAIIRRKEQTYLANHVIKTKQAETELECGMHCVGDRSCASANYKTSGIGKSLCELNSKTLQETSDADGNTDNPDFNLLYIIKKKPEDLVLSSTLPQLTGKSSTAINPLYAKFTNLGATGHLGPTSLGSHYVGKDHENMVSVQTGMQFWTVPYTGTYEITAVGAAGGLGVSGSAPGRGAYMRGVFGLIKGDVLKILVGQEGVQNTRGRSSGGGGGTFVATSSNTPLIVAGGGGGMETLNQRFANCDASTGTSGRKNKCLLSCEIWSGGLNGKGASEADTSNSGGGGGGFYSNGRSSKQFGGAYGNGGEGGRGFVQGGAGGRAWYNDAVGGFGGGGGAYGSGGGAGGGGGYSGGASGNNNGDSCGGGGGSFNTGNNQINKEGYLASGHGYVEIRRLA